MRKILFRGYDLKTCRWVFGQLIQDGDVCIITDGDATDKWVVVDTNSVGQWIGKEDSKGVRIFEGDHVCFEDSYCGEYRTVLFDQEFCTYCLMDSDNSGDIPPYSDYFDVVYAVVGNEYEKSKGEK